jgi:mono/diheme cytochrome c family protein
MPRGHRHTREVCARTGDNVVRDVICTYPPRTFKGIAELQSAFGVGSETDTPHAGISITAGSTALSARSVSAINPRLLAMRFTSRELDLVVTGYARGEQVVELAVTDHNDHQLHFYVLAYRLACNEDERGCSPGDLLTEAAERDWTQTTLYDEYDLANTVLDCNTCHQPDGPGTPRILRMQEFNPPWTHWLSDATEGGSVLLEDYFAAKGNEPIAGMPRIRIERANPSNLLALLLARQESEPSVFDGETIEAEVQQSALLEGVHQPEDNSVPGQSATWQLAYERAMRGETIPVPYHDVKVTDPQKLASLTLAYQQYLAGLLPRQDLPDLRDVYPDDPALLADMGFMTRPGLEGKDVLLQACSQCHNDRLDQRVTRAGFNVDLQKLGRPQKDNAIARLLLPDDDLHAMPPRRIRSLSEQARTRLIKLLSQ